MMMGATKKIKRRIAKVTNECQRCWCSRGHGAGREGEEEASNGDQAQKDDEDELKTEMQRWRTELEDEEEVKRRVTAVGCK